MLKVLESEIISREQVVNALGSRAQQMVRSGHFASSRIEAAHSDLLEKLAKIKQLVKERKLKLLDAVESQMVCLFLFALNVFFNKIINHLLVLIGKHMIFINYA